jgi:hypothetical protein
MTKKKPVKETATARQKLYPSTKKRFKVKAAKRGINVPELLEEVSKMKV